MSIDWAWFERTHSEEQCAGRTCVVHNPTRHHMSTWPQIWRWDRGIVERRCLHGIGHPDPDQFEYWKETGQKWQGIHGCDGCCAQPHEEVTSNDGSGDTEQGEQAEGLGVRA